jgi:probable addiction module antidote protein
LGKSEEGVIMSKAKVSHFDASDYLDSEEAITEYLNAAIDDGDPEILMAAIADVVKARGLTKVAADAGLGRESLYKTLKPGSKPQLGTVMKLLHALNVKLNIQPEAAHA